MTRRILVFHGYRADPSTHWFDWLAAEFPEDSVFVPTLPDSTQPDLGAWLATAIDAIGTPDQSTVIVGHSLGAVTALHALDKVQGEWSLGGLVVVSGFVEPIPGLALLDPFTAEVPDLARTRDRTAVRSAILSDNDAIVPPAATIRLAESLDAHQLVVPGAGHFLASEGATSLPALAEVLRSAQQA